MKIYYATLLGLLLFCSSIHAGPASKDLLSKLDTKITYKSEGQTIAVQLEKYTKLSNIYFYIEENAKENLKLNTKKFTYANVRAKYILYRLLKEAGLKHKYEGDTVNIYKP